MAGHGLGPHELEQYHDRGYVVRRKLLLPEQLHRLRDETEKLHDEMARRAPAEVHISWEDLPGDRPKKIRQLMHSEKVCPTLDAVSRSPQVLDVVEQLLGPDILLFHSKLLMKAARDGSFTPWHQDYGYWRFETKEPTQVNCQIAIDPSKEVNGALWVVPGSHHGGLKAHKDFKTDSFSIGFEGGLDAFPGTLVEMDPGDGIFFGPLLIHCSGPNRADFDRRANTFAFDKPGNRLKGELPAATLRRGKYPAA
jgi:ectoine hydroxylase-related dioxygenase (phytanoyl-CoA dioxygenase family)